MRYVFLALAVWGVIHPMTFFLRWFARHGLDLGGMVSAWHANAATSGLVWDLTVAAVALTLWILTDLWRSRDWLRLIAVPATFLIGVGCGLPLYLYLRLRKG